MKSILCKNLACALIIACFGITSCQDSAQKSDAAKADSAVVQGADTSHTGLEGTQEQQSSLSTDVKVDTSSGQGTRNVKEAHKGTDTSRSGK